MRQNLGTDIVSGKTTVFGKGMAEVRDAGLSQRRGWNMGSGHFFQTLIEENTACDHTRYDNSSAAPTGYYYKKA